MVRQESAFSDAQNLDQLRQALELGIGHYRRLGWSTPFGLYAASYRDQIARRAELGLVSLVTLDWLALLDRAILDALGRALGLSFAEMIAGSIRGDRGASRADFGSLRLRPAAIPAADCGRAAPLLRATRSASSIPSSGRIRRLAIASTTACRKRWRKWSAHTARVTSS